jgi:arabinogalactan oligomer/maltooligosaccharide transport system permease protein
MSSVTRTATNRPRRVQREGPVVANRRARTLVRLIVVIIGSIFSLYPFIVIVSASFDPTNSLSGQNLIPPNPSLLNYQKLLANEQTPIFRWLLNSLTVSSISAVVTLTLTTLAAYSFSRFRYTGRRASLQTTLLIQVFPSVLGLVAFYLLLQQLGEIIPWIGLNSLGGLIIIYTGGALGANAWLMKGYFDTIPREIDESALVDGATHWTTFTRIILPLIRPILAVIAILSFVGSFNDYLIPRVLLRDRDVFTLAVGLTTFLNNEFAVNWGVFAAGALIGTLPIIFIFLALQTQIVGGLSQGAVKG